VRALIIGDVFGSVGLAALLGLLPSLRERMAPDLVVVNAENAAGGAGTHPRQAADLFEAGVDVLTGGNHTLRQTDYYPVLESDPRALRPANLSPRAPGRGLAVVDVAGGGRVAVVNLLGSVFMDAGASPFMVVDELVERARRGARHVIVDMHAEATSEKVGLGWYLDGRVTAVVGTHTHVPTADLRVLPGGTAYITDVGMTGPRGGVIGVKKDQAIESLRTHMSVRFETSADDPWLNGVVIRASKPLRADSIDQVLEPWTPSNATMSGP
jgi:2',3'-cyclic-nucleotide 2'-phosphodiesterase